MKPRVQLSTAALAALLAMLTACGSPPSAQTTTAGPLATSAAAISAPTAALPEPEAEIIVPTVAAPAPDAATAAPDAATAAPDAATAAAPPTPTFAPPTADDAAIIATVARPIKEAYPKTPVLVGVLGVEGDYAAALAAPFGNRPQFAFLQRSNGKWKTIFVGSTPSGEQLTQAGVPDSLTSASDTYAVMDTWMAQLQNTQDGGLDGTVAIEGIVGDYARGQFTPNDPTTRDGTTAFFKRIKDSWVQLTAGTGFAPDDLTQLGIPKALWPGNS